MAAIFQRSCASRFTVRWGARRDFGWPVRVVTETGNPGEFRMATLAAASDVTSLRVAPSSVSEVWLADAPHLTCFSPGFDHLALHFAAE